MIPKNVFKQSIYKFSDQISAKQKSSKPRLISRRFSRCTYLAKNAVSPETTCSTGYSNFNKQKSESTTIKQRQLKLYIKLSE